MLYPLSYGRADTKEEVDSHIVAQFTNALLTTRANNRLLGGLKNIISQAFFANLKAAARLLKAWRHVAVYVQGDAHN